jgi:hypothetical protein
LAMASSSVGSGAGGSGAFDSTPVCWAIPVPTHFGRELHPSSRRAVTDATRKERILHSELRLPPCPMRARR